MALGIRLGMRDVTFTNPTAGGAKTDNVINILPVSDYRSGGYLIAPTMPFWAHVVGSVVKCRIFTHDCPEMRS